MKKGTNKLISIFFISMLILLLGNPAAFAESQWDQVDVPVDKVWTITFNQEIDKNTINKGIYIEDSKGQKVSNLIVQSVSNSKIKVTNLKKYKFDETYHLYITKEIKSKKGSPLKKEVHLVFKTVSGGTTIPELPEVSSFILGEDLPGFGQGAVIVKLDAENPEDYIVKVGDIVLEYNKEFKDFSGIVPLGVTKDDVTVVKK